MSLNECSAVCKRITRHVLKYLLHSRYRSMYWTQFGHVCSLSNLFFDLLFSNNEYEYADFCFCMRACQKEVFVISVKYIMYRKTYAVCDTSLKTKCYVVLCFRCSDWVLENCYTRSERSSGRDRLNGRTWVSYVAAKRWLLMRTTAHCKQQHVALPLSECWWNRLGWALGIKTRYFMMRAAFC